MGETKTDDTIVETGTSGQEETQNAGGAVQETGEVDKTEADNGVKTDETDKDKTKVEPTPTADEEPKTRKRNVDFIIERKNKQIEKLKNKGDGAGASDTEVEDEDDLDDDDARVIDKRVTKILSPFINKQMQEEDNGEINAFVASNPDFAPYVDKVKKFAQHPTRKDLPIESIFYEVAGKDLLMLGAKRAQQLKDEVKETNAGGGGSDTGGANTSVWDLTPEQFAAKQNEIRNKNRE